MSLSLFGLNKCMLFENGPSRARGEDYFETTRHLFKPNILRQDGVPGLLCINITRIVDILLWSIQAVTSYCAISQSYKLK